MPFKVKRTKLRTNKGSAMLNIIELIALRFLYLSNLVDSDRRADLVVKAIGWVLMFNLRYVQNIQGKLSSKLLN